MTTKNLVYDLLILFFVGILFCSAFIISGIVSNQKVLRFLKFNKDWDPSFIIFFGMTILLNMISFNIILKKVKQPINHDEYNLPLLNNTNKCRIVIGSIFLGIGWGITGMFPANMIINLQFLTPHITLCYFFSFILGQWIVARVSKCILKNELNKNLGSNGKYCYFSNF